MDPNANLEEQRRIAQRLIDVTPDDPARSQTARLAELVLALDEWITGGGFLPKAWERPVPNLNGATLRYLPGGTVHLVLPRELWRYDGFGCGCDYCDNSPGSGAWDILVIPAKPRDKRHSINYATNAHAPEYHGAKKFRKT